MKGLYKQHWHVWPLWPFAAHQAVKSETYCLLAHFLFSSNTSLSPSALPFLLVFFSSQSTCYIPPTPHFYPTSPSLTLQHLFPLACWFPPTRPPMSSLLQCSSSHLGWDYSHHAVSVPRWTEGWVWLLAVQELYVSRHYLLPTTLDSKTIGLSEYL